MGVPKHNSSSDSKCGKWSLGKDVKNNPPLLEDMGLSPLQQVESDIPVNCNVSEAVVSTSQKRDYSVYDLENIDKTDFFVFKRRKIDCISGEDKFNKLTEEVVLLIFQWLPKFMLARCAQVCKRWKRLAFDETLWRRLDLGAKTLNPGVVGRVLLRGTYSLRLAKAEIASPIFCPQLQHVSSYSEVRSKLQNLDLSMAAIEPKALAELLSVCCQLKKVSLEHCSVSPECCMYLSQNKELDTLNMAMCYDLNSEGLLEIFNKSSNLQALNLAWTNLSSEELNLVCNNLPNSLLRLNLSGCRETLNDNHIRHITLATPSLLELDVSDASQLTAASVALIIKRLKELEYLSFARCFNITPDAYLKLKCMKNLLYLDVYGILDDRALATVRDYLPNIKVNKYLFSSVARPTVGVRRTSIWGVRVRD